MPTAGVPGSPPDTATDATPLASSDDIEWTGGFDTVWLAFAVCAAGASALAMTTRRRAVT